MQLIGGSEFEGGYNLLPRNSKGLLILFFCICSMSNSGKKLAELKKAY